MKSWTVAEMKAEGPCSKYTINRLTELWAGRDQLTLLDICDLDIPDADKMWCAFRPAALTEAQRSELLDRIVIRAVTNHALHCGVPEVEAWAQKWLSGEDRTAAAAYAAAAADAAAAAAAAAYAARAADAAYAAAAADAAAAERSQQVADLREVLEESK